MINKNFEGKKIFISGGAGVIGNYLVEKLHAAGAIIFVGDLQSFPAHWSQDILYRKGDLNYISKKEMDNFNPEYFFHLAATFERTKETLDFWEENFTHNVKLSNHLMSILKESKTLKRVIFASSYLIYDEKQYLFEEPTMQPVKLNEYSSIRPRNICGAAKLLHETELQFLSQFDNYRFTSVSARIYRSFGKNSRDIVSRWIRSLLQKEIIHIYNRESLFDYIYAEEVAEGLLRLAISDITGIINLGSGKARRINDVISILKNYFPDLKFLEQNPIPPFEASQADMLKTFNLLGWIPEKQLEQGIEEIINFEKEHFNKVLPIAKGNNVLITSSSSKITLIHSVKNAITKIGGKRFLYSADSSSEVISKNFTDKFWNMPNISKITASEIISFCKHEDIGFIIPTRDGELSFFSTIKDDLEKEQISVMISGIDAVKKCLDKLLFYEFCKSCGFPTIETVKSITLINSQKYVVKEQFGAGSKSIGIELSKEEAISHATTLQSPIFQPFIKGKEYSVDAYNDKRGNVKGVIVRERIKIVGGESKITQKGDNIQLEEVTTNLVKELNIYGHSVTQIIVDDKNKPYILECNSRFGGASNLSVACGLDSFYWFLLESMGEDISKYPFTKENKPLKMIRYETDLFL